MKELMKDIATFVVLFVIGSAFIWVANLIF
jgi:hypothetical protein